MSPIRLLPVAIALAAFGCKPEPSTDGDTDTTVTVSYADADGDLILDLHEDFVDPEMDTDGGVSADSDGDGTPDYLDLDSDDDGIEDAIEGGDDDFLTLPWDSDGDGVFDFRDTDADGNCILDADEGTGDNDQDGIPGFQDLDDDADGILDVVEIGEDCAIPDSDGDGKPDFQDKDADGDGIGDQWEAGTSAWETEPRDTDGDGTPDYLDLDSDGDGMSDSEEGGVSKPADEPRDTDGDGIYDFFDTDSDGDGITDKDEIDVHGTDAYDSDTDGDGYSDGAEISAGTDPIDDGSVIEGLYVTVGERTNVEESFEFELNVQMGDVAFLIDTTCSMSGTLTGMRTEFSNIVTDLSSTLPDANYAVTSFDDYAYSGYGSVGYDKPFWLNQQLTDDTTRVQSALTALKIHSGADGPESGMEGIYQAMSGRGYDQDCDDVYDSSTDVPPFIAASTDAFAGKAADVYDASVPGTGTGGGVGFRSYALPIVVYAGDNYLRDPESSYGAPPACSDPAGFSDVVAATTDIGATLIGISAGSSTGVAQLNALSDATSSYADTDGDGYADDRLVFTWTSSSSALRSTIVKAIEDLVGSVKFSEVSLEVDGDPYGFVTDIQPETYTLSSSASGQVVDFTLTFRGAVAATEEDQVFRLSLNVVGDGSILLDTLDIFVVVPGTSY